MKLIISLPTFLLIILLQFSTIFPPSHAQQDGDNKIMEFRIKGKNSTHKMQAKGISRVVDESSLNNIVESYSPADFIFNSCELGKYRAPVEFTQIFPYYLSGYDEAGRPIWVGEFGKYDLKRVTSGGSEIQEAFDKYSNDVTYNMIKSLFTKSTPGRPIFQFIFIVDFEGLGFDQMTVGNLGYLIKLARRYSQMIDEYSHSVVVINVNYVAELLTNMFRPVFGRLFEKVVVFGTNKSKWLPYMKNNFPKNSIPEWYGGTADFKPVSIHG